MLQTPVRSLIHGYSRLVSPAGGVLRPSLVAELSPDDGPEGHHLTDVK